MRGVELDRELAAGEAEPVVDRAEDRRGVAERERILQVAGRARLHRYEPESRSRMRAERRAMPG